MVSASYRSQSIAQDRSFKYNAKGAGVRPRTGCSGCPDQSGIASGGDKHSTSMWSVKAQVGSSQVTRGRVDLAETGTPRRKVWSVRQDPGNSMLVGEAEEQTGLRPWKVKGTR